jgi:ClpP class serine protease
MNYSIMRNDPVVAKYYQMYLEYKDVLDKAKSLKEVTTAKLNRIIAAQKGIGAIYQEFITVLTEALRVWEAE